LLIKLDKNSNLNENKEDKIKGIVVEFDGPHHYFSPIINQ